MEQNQTEPQKLQTPHTDAIKKEFEPPSVAPPPQKFTSLAKAMLEAQRRIKNAAKDRENDHFKNVYATLESVLDAVKDIANECGILIVQNPEHDGKGYVLVTKLIHDSGEVMESRMNLIMDRQNMQALGSAITYARRYTLASLFCIGQEDDDGNATNSNKGGQSQGQNGGNRQPQQNQAPRGHQPAQNGAIQPKPQQPKPIPQPQQPRQQAPYTLYSGDPSDFQLPVGPNKGKPLKELGCDYNMKMVEWLKAEYAAKKQQIPMNIMDYMLNVKHYIDQVNSPEPPAPQAAPEEVELDVPDFGLNPNAPKGPTFP